MIWPYPKKMTYVISRHNWPAKENVNFITENIIETITEIRNMAEKDILLAGGSELISMLLSADMIDKMYINYFPVILGKGIPLFLEQEEELMWELIQSKPYTNGILEVIYQRKHKHNDKF